MKNTTAKIMRYTAIIMGALGFIGGIILGNLYPIASGLYYPAEKFNSALMIASWVGTFISSLLFYSIGEIVLLLAKHEEQNEQLIYLLKKQYSFTKNPPSAIAKSKDSSPPDPPYTITNSIDSFQEKKHSVTIKGIVKGSVK